MDAFRLLLILNIFSPLFCYRNWHRITNGLFILFNELYRDSPFHILGSTSSIIYFYSLGYAFGNSSCDIKIHIHLDFTIKLFNHTSCQLINPQAIMYAEAILFTADKIKREKLLGNYTLGLQFKDTCENTKLNAYFAVIYHGTAVLGPHDSELALFTTNFLSPFEISTISFGASSNKFYSDNQEGFPFFWSTVPSDGLGSNVYRDMATKFDWQFTSLIETNDEDGRSLTNDVIKKMEVSNYCVTKRTLPKKASEKAYHEEMKVIVGNVKAKTVFLFLSFKGCIDFILAANTFPEKERLKEKQFVLGTQCGAGLIVPREVGEFFNGMLTVQAEKPQPKQFTEYFSALLPRGNSRNEYHFKFYWELSHSCNLSNQRFKKNCGYGRSDRVNAMAPVRPAIDALLAAVQGARKTLSECPPKNESGCPQKTLHKHLSLVNFNTFEKNFTFTKEKQVFNSYDVLQYQEVSPGKFFFKRIAFWDVDVWKKNKFALSVKQNASITFSRCSFACSAQEVHVYSGSCCWECKTCPSYSIIVDNTCKSCDLGFKANHNQTKCDELPIVTMSPFTNLSIVVIMISVVQCIAILLIVCVYFKHFSSHVIKSSSRELALFSLFGLFLMLVTPVLFVLSPVTMVCHAQKMSMGMSLACCYSPLVLKTNRVFRIFDSSNKFKLRRLVLVSMTSQFLLIGAILGVELVMSVFWILTDQPPVTRSFPPQNNMALEQCNISSMGALLNLTFPIALMMASTYWAFKTRNLPETFSEIKSIGATMYVTLFLATIAFTFVFIMEEVTETPFLETYVVCFTFQAIVCVNLIGQYATKINILHIKKDEIHNTNTEISVVMSNRFHSPCESPKEIVRSRPKFCETSFHIRSDTTQNNDWK